MNDITELLKAHHRLIDDCNIASLKVVLALPKDSQISTVEERRVGNLCCSIREDALFSKLREMKRIYDKYGKYSEYELKEVVISYTLYARLRDAKIVVKRVFK